MGSTASAAGAAGAAICLRAVLLRCCTAKGVCNHFVFLMQSIADHFAFLMQSIADCSRVDPLSLLLQPTHVQSFDLSPAFLHA